MKAMRNFFRHIRDALRSMSRHGLSSGTTILMMTLTLLTVGGLILFMVNVENVASNIEEGVKIRVHIDLEADAEAEAVLREEILALDYVEEVQYRTKEEELEDVVETYGEEFANLAGDANPLYNVFAVNISDLNYLGETSDQIAGLDNVASVDYGEGSTQSLVDILQTARYFIALFAAVMVVFSVIRVSNTTKITIAARETDIEIMELVGATPGYIEAPFIIEGGLFGLISAIIGSLILFFSYRGLRSASMAITGMNLIVNIPIFPIMIIVVLVLLILGVVLGILGANRSVKTYLNRD